MSKSTSLVAMTIKYRSDWDKIMDAIHRKEEIEPEYFKLVDALKCQVVTLLDAEYPQMLRNAFKPPFVLFYYGDLSLAQDYHKIVSIVGSRDCSDYGARITREIAGDLAKKGYIIASGLAKGIDSIAHEAAISSGGKTIAVLGNGIDFCYLKDNRELYKEIRNNHLVISEYPFSMSPEPYYFPIRNRIIASICKTLVVTEAGYNSGSLITATLAIRGNTTVMCVPHEAGKQSECNRLILNGANLVENAQDVIDQMALF